MQQAQPEAPFYPDDEHIKTFCRPWAPDGCVWLLVGRGRHLECSYFDRPKYVERQIQRRAIRGNCDGCEMVKAA